MTWVKIDQHTFEDPKIEEVSPEAGWFWLAALCYCNRQMTDGRVTRVGINKIAASAKADDPWPLVDELVRLEMLCREDESDDPDNPGAVWWLVNYAKYQPMRDHVAAQRAANARRQALFRNEPMKASIRLRDASRCRYCGKRVAWQDRRSPGGATYDHVDPQGANSFENIVVACRACNSAKGRRTPGEAGMTLLPPPNPTSPPPAGQGESYLDSNQLHRNGRGVTANGMTLPERPETGRSGPVISPEALEEMRRRRRISA